MNGTSNSKSARPDVKITHCHASTAKSPKFSLLYAIDSDQTEKSIICSPDFPRCSYSFWYGAITIYGSISKTRLDRFEAFAAEITKILDAAKVSERTVELSQFRK